MGATTRKGTRQAAASVRQVGIRTETIRLAAFLKWVRVAESGGQAKQLVQAGRVRVNGVVEQHRGRQLVAGDHVAVGTHTFVIARE